ncbi:hypothetical protein [Methylomonas sp. AM2-LC]|uniref:hypothetical protein n=1 Tax=Methylomonas sp. AM2-LC TaxID=3153301 RepID=UPI0032659C3D
MKVIDAANHNTSPIYAKTLIIRTGKNQQELAELLNLTRVTIGKYWKGTNEIPYPVQVCLEILADQNTDENGRQIITLTNGKNIKT